MSQRITQRIIAQPALSRALQRRLFTPAVSHDFDVVSDPPPVSRVAPTEQADDKAAEPAQHGE